MQAAPSILSPHHKILDFLNRFSDVALLGISLAVTIEGVFAKEWGKNGTTQKSKYINKRTRITINTTEIIQAYLTKTIKCIWKLNFN